MKYSPKYFDLREFRCPCCGRVKIAASLVFWLDHLRRAWDDPIPVNSGFRCLKRNKLVGGAEQSRHLIGCAADIRPHDPALIEPFKILIKHLTAGLTRRIGWEVREYSTFVHVAVPRGEALKPWGGGSIDIMIQ